MKKIYCAGPLFNPKEKEEMQEIATILENNGFDVFLPHRDGFEFVNLSESFIKLGVSDNNAKLILNKAIFTLDVFQVIDSDGLILNINGRVPDEGAMVEAGIAWNAGKTIVIFKNDARTLINGNDNPLLLGLANFNVANEISSIPSIFNKLFLKDGDKKNKIIDNSRIEKIFKKGQLIFELSNKSENSDELCNQLINILEIKDVPAIR
ncbi:MAG TPA: nucleoside 2-deoxyribosyltransferase [Ignavibacteria bacterium]|nr:nucleoside 2-deoxyribosyltransferase [Ignavibacteria bacterium]